MKLLKLIVIALSIAGLSASTVYAGGKSSGYSKSKKGDNKDRKGKGKKDKGKKSKKSSDKDKKPYVAAPDTGSTAIMLGGAMLAAAALRRKMKR